MNIIDVTGLKWLNPDHTLLGGQVVTDKMGIIPICIHDEYDTPEGQKLWNDAIAGRYGPIFDYTAPPEPTPEERRAMMPDLEKWRVDTIIDLEPGLREKIDAAIDKWPEPKRTIGKNKFKSVTNFSRRDPLFDDVGSDKDVGKTPDDIDAMWAAGAALPPSLHDIGYINY
ncbi:hypothetical protein [Brucella inopinata]|uniref:Uncharacterized protein n=1 Tax=Brucella inopinata TaxID=1218315 RepID=A0AAW7B6D6_9HYPH|nr:hypothetical protein [Brucella inopinata]MDL2332452.1 hypothetical protein [Brucella inopinata]